MFALESGDKEGPGLIKKREVQWGKSDQIFSPIGQNTYKVRSIVQGRLLVKTGRGGSRPAWEEKSKNIAEKHGLVPGEEKGRNQKHLRGNKDVKREGDDVGQPKIREEVPCARSLKKNFSWRDKGHSSGQTKSRHEQRTKEGAGERKANEEERSTPRRGTGKG